MIPAHGRQDDQAWTGFPSVPGPPCAEFEQAGAERREVVRIPDAMNCKVVNQFSTFEEAGPGWINMPDRKKSGNRFTLLPIRWPLLVALFGGAGGKNPGGG